MSEPNPNCAKLLEVAAQRDTLEAFLDFLDARSIRLGAYHEHGAGACESNLSWDGRYVECAKSEDRLYPVSFTRDALLYEFFGIDAVALEAERRALLDGLRR